MTSIPFQAKEIALRKLQHMSDEYIQINPFKKVPAINDSGFILTESVAILTYLCNKHKKSNWYPTDLHEQARVNEYTHWQHLNLRLTGSTLFQTKVVIPAIKKQPPTDHELEKWHKRWQGSTDGLENVWLNRSSYLAGNHITIADLLGICEMMQPIAAGYNLDTKKFPRVQDWMERVKKETQPYFDEVHVVSMRLREKILKEEKQKIY
ncbi:unnamed protein product [Rotaria sordida]|uniref:Uncharacterized protein n=1 Tax=Rotaria sordida TaxID=392033 RepID=A0A814CBA9_9BILA|nr:unnamed protein product [Rotaria sordida]CAF1336108.1 unnamed protein product [Rotaria sordida]